jgi:hypothetical protein
MTLTSTPNQDSDQEVDADADQSTDASATYIPSNWCVKGASNERCREADLVRNWLIEAETEPEHTTVYIHGYVI